MHDLAPLIKDLAVILGVASLVTILFQKIRQPVVLGYLVAGIIIGPYTPPHALVSDIPNIKILSELGVIFLMFSLGLEFSFHKLKRVGVSASITGIFEVIFMLFLGLATGTLLGWSFYNSLFLGAALAISSTTIIIKALEELHVKSKRFAEIIFGILIVEDLLAILLLVGLSTVVNTSNIFSLAMVWAVLKLVVVVGGWFLTGYFLMPSLFRKIIHYTSEETLTIIAIALCLFLVCVASYFHYSTALGAFIMGSILAETPLVHCIEQLVQPIRNIFAAVFFVSVGMLIDPKIIWTQLPSVFLICLVVIMGKLLITSIGAFLTGQSINSSIRIGFSMAQIGEFSFIIAGLGLALNVTNDALYPIIVAVSAITTFTTPYLIKLSGYLNQTADQYLPNQLKYFLEGYTAWLYRLTSNRKQQSLYRNSVIRLIINGIIITILFTVTQHWLLPKIGSLVNNTAALTKILGWLTAILLSSPFIWGMLNAFRPVKQSLQPTFSKWVAVYLAYLLPLLEIIVLSIAYFDTWWVSLLLILIVLAFFALLYKQLDKSYRWFESQLIRNLQTNASQHQRYEELAPWDTHLVEVEINRQSPLVNKTLNVLQLRQQFGINIVGIYRGSTILLSPRGEQILLPFDRLILLGHDEQIERFTTQYINPKIETPSIDLLENFIIKTFLIDENNPIVGKTIRESLLREKTKSIVVGLERRGNRTLNPDSTTVLESGDLLFIVGEMKYLEDM